VEDGIEEAAEEEHIPMEGYDIWMEWDVFIETLDFTFPIFYEVFNHFQFYFTEYQMTMPNLK
jgi:hypothetical protein